MERVDLICNMKRYVKLAKRQLPHIERGKMDDFDIDSSKFCTKRRQFVEKKVKIYRPRFLSFKKVAESTYTHM